ncbi:DNA-binding response regulator, OmpR family, contains REC and winged-helix (wHTH) domain [Lachnospiraceae bacterium NE2001]|nr:DNA-binding response regulator, OmpR family, contains REC and winged-helix (wHTH) domain [Lachnospiraceae bacterium NE2001]
MILVIEDDVMINNLLCKVLSDNGYETDSAFDGEEGLNNALAKEYEMILLDLMLPKKTGEEVLGELRKTRNTPAIVLSAKNEVINRIELLRLGADDYISKPFDVDEVILRIEAVLRRTGSVSAPTTLEYKNLKLDKEAKRVFIEENEIACTVMEFSILELMMENPNKVFSKRNLFESVTGEDYMSDDNTMNVHMSNLRKKIAKVTDEPYIDTVYGMGYRLSK